MKKSLFLFAFLFYSCSHRALNLKTEVNRLYVNDTPIKCEVYGQTSKIDMSECLGKIYLYETKENLPKVSTKLFDDIESGDPRLPYVLTAIYRGFVNPSELSVFGANEPVNTENWEKSVKKLKEEIKNHEKRTLRIRLK
jgi:hypothetical protein